MLGFNVKLSNTFLMSYKRDYLSYSSLKAFEKGPNHYIEYVTAERSEPSAAMKFGTAFHCRLLEPEDMDQRYVVGPKPNLRTKAGQQFVADVEADGKIFLADTELEVIDLMVKSVRDNHWANKLCMTMSDAFELPVMGEINGYNFKGFIDVAGRSYNADIKTTSDGSPAAFARQASDLGYHIQAAVYSNLTGKEFYWIAVENKPPYNCTVYSQSQEDFEMSTDYLFHLIDRFKEWDGLRHNSGYAEGEEIYDLALSPWSKIVKFARNS